MRFLLLALLSGIPALAYQVVWTRQVALVAGSQIEAISVVLVAFFGGLAFGSWRIGAVADRLASPLALYAGLELAVGLLGAASLPVLRTLADIAWSPEGEWVLLVLCGGVLFPVTTLLGGTLPALLRAALREHRDLPRRAGWILGCNTAGSVAGVALAVEIIPVHGLRAAVLAAAAVSLAIGAMALAISRRTSTARLDPPEQHELSPGALLAAALAGFSTLGFEVLAARMAALQLGSSLYAWAAVLALMLLGLAAGNLLFGARAGRSDQPSRDLGWIQVAAASAIALGLSGLAPLLSRSAPGLTPASLLAVTLGVFPCALLMGAAFPFFVRLAARGTRPAAAFGTVSALNTAGGIAGAIAAPFALLPLLGPGKAALCCAGINLALAIAFLSIAPPRGPRASVRIAVALLVFSAAALAGLSTRRESAGWHVLNVSYGRQATAVVVQAGARRDLIVDGDSEASTAGDARRTEEIMAALPVLLHPAPQSFLELGLGSGITLGTAQRLPLERVECVEIAQSVIQSAQFFAPDNGGVALTASIVRGDARNHLLRHRSQYDIVVANTLHPWSVGATGLYSVEYFRRVAAALRPGGLALQWLPIDRIEDDSLAAILRTFYHVFPEGELRWGAGNLIAVGATAQLPSIDASRIGERLGSSGLRLAELGLATPAQIGARRIATAANLRRVLGGGELLSDDRPVLEGRATRGRAADLAPSPLATLVDLAKLQAQEDRRAAGVLLWLEALEARQRGDVERADARESLAALAGLEDLVAEARARRSVAQAYRELSEGNFSAADRSFLRALSENPGDRDARFGRAGVALQSGRAAQGVEELEELVAERPEDAQAWNELASAYHAERNTVAARRAVERALQSNPYYPDAIVNAGLLAAAAGDVEAARAFLARVRAISPLGRSAGEEVLSAALTRIESPSS